MKANEAPEKIILLADRDTEELSDYWAVNDSTDNIKIEYIRTDALIKKVEGNIIYPDKRILTWGPYYFHSMDKAIEKTEEVLKYITEWCNGKDPSLSIKPMNLKRLGDGEQIIFDIQAWKDENTLENCHGIITIKQIMFKD